MMWVLLTWRRGYSSALTNMVATIRTNKKKSKKKCV
jgi:hypothetical protein